MRLLWVVLLVGGIGAGACGADRPGSSTGPMRASAARPFCEVVADVNELYRTTSSVEIDSDMSADEVRGRVASFEESVDASIARGEALFVELQAAAPSELVTDVRLLAEDAIRRAEAVRTSGGDAVELWGLWPPSDNAELQAARARVKSHTRAACGTSFGPPTAPVGPAARPPRGEPPAPAPPAPPPPPQR